MIQRRFREEKNQNRKEGRFTMLPPQKHVNLDTMTLVGWLDRVIKSFGDVVAVSDVSFAIPKGKIVGFLGPNGAGKTTSIKLLLGLLRPNQGEVRLFGRDPFTEAWIKQHVGYVPEGDTFPRWMKARDYVYQLSRYSLTPSEARKRTREILEQVELSEVARKRIVQFSKGMKQRIKIAQALVHHPLLIIADEPFNGLDPVMRHKMYSLFKQYQEEFQTTFFVSSHILFEVERLADQIILLYRGRTIAQGSPRRIRELVHEVPHSIAIITPEITTLAKLLLDYREDIQLSEIRFTHSSLDKQPQLIVETHKPAQLYRVLTELIADHEIPVMELQATNEGLENLYQALTRT